jgi:peptidoglycan/LPS O-acetylase OafA/YrhL
MVHPVSAQTPAKTGHLAVLDGWRALCILMVIAGHQLPLNAIIPGGNSATAAGGMAIFFTLSGFLITRFLWERPEPRPFLIRRVMRILPLAWLAMLGLFVAQGPGRSLEELIANLLFYSNLPPSRLFEGGGHLWSLAVEMHFYTAIALVVAVFGRRGLLAIPLCALAVTTARILAEERISIVTWHRVDEILAGSTIALIYLGAFGKRPLAAVKAVNFYVALVIAVACVYLMDSPLAYGRPYAVALLVATTLWGMPALLKPVFESRPAAYIAKISYALYVFHVILDHTWLGSGDTLEKYLKRPLLFAATFLAAHVSTHYWEDRFIKLAKKWTTKKS